MRERFTYKSFHEQLVADVFPAGLSDADAMLLFALLHTHKIRLAGTPVHDFPQVQEFAPITQRQSAGCLACLWRGTTDSRAHYLHWYWKWNTEWSYERVESLAGPELQRFEKIKHAIEAHPSIDSVLPEDS